MKKVTIIALAAMLAVFFTVPAFALDMDFTGYWRTRAYTNANFTGNDNKALDLSLVDTRTRFWLNAKINDNLKMVSGFEMDTMWGEAGTGYGDIGTDGQRVEIKHSYADVTLGPVFARIGAQGAAIGRGFLFSDDFAGVALNYQPSSQLSIPFYWMKNLEGGQGTRVFNGSVVENNDFDVDYYAISPVFKPSSMLSINPYFMYITATNAANMVFERTAGSIAALDIIRNFGGNITNLDSYFLGVDLDVKLKMASLWFTGIYQTGNADQLVAGVTREQDISAYLVAGGATVNFGAFDVHGQAFLATGDNNALDNDIEAFTMPRGQSYAWAEIMGEGIDDFDVTDNSPCTDQTNIIALNIGVGFKATDKLKITFDIWNAQLAEERLTAVLPNGTQQRVDDLGTEFDLLFTYQLVKGLTLDVWGAYLLTGDGTYTAGEQVNAAGVALSQENAYDIGAQLSLKF